MPQATLVHHLLEQATARHSDDVFLIHEGGQVRYRDLDANANRMARVLLDEGLRPGDRVGLLCRNSPLYVESYYGVLKAGGVVVPLNTASDGPALAASLTRCEARMLIVGPGHERVAREALRAGAPLDRIFATDTEPEAAASRQGAWILLEPRRRAASPEPPEREIAEDAVASIVFTSGSTGAPQGATLSHRNLVSNTLSIVRYLELGAEDRVFCVLPFYYVYGKSLLNTHAAVGGSIVIENQFLYLNPSLDRLEQTGCTGFAGVPSTFAILLNRSNLAERKLERLRYVTQAGGAMSPALTRRLMQALPRQSIFVMYGATEASARLSWLPPADLERKLGSIGRAIPGVELRVLRRDGSECEVGEVGEIVARGPNIMSGYWNDPEATARVLDRHGYHTGDLARRDEEGFLFIVGRSYDFIKSGAHRISAREIEDKLLELPEVHEAAVVGLPDEVLGERIVAFVVARDGCSLDASAALRALRRKLPAYKLPAEIRLRDDLPKNEAGKVMKQRLREEEADEGATAQAPARAGRSPGSAAR
jgi:long-chain acyl-CoA synthetase